MDCDYDSCNENTRNNGNKLMEKKSEYIDTKELARELAVTPETLLMWSSKGKFPKPIKLSHKTRRWKRATVENFLNQKQIEAKVG